MGSPASSALYSRPGLSVYILIASVDAALLLLAAQLGNGEEVKIWSGKSSHEQRSEFFEKAFVPHVGAGKDCWYTYGYHILD